MSANGSSNVTTRRPYESDSRSKSTATSMQWEMFAANCEATSSNETNDRPGGGPTHHDTTGHEIDGHHDIFG